MQEAFPPPVQWVDIFLVYWCFYADGQVETVVGLFWDEWAAMID